MNRIVELDSIVAIIVEFFNKIMYEVLARYEFC